MTRYRGECCEEAYALLAPYADRIAVTGRGWGCCGSVHALAHLAAGIGH